ncbi:MAG TPA: hypothetical protein VGG28_08160 [Kofleriaceae bacterium]|jgi:hypothetical protein
MIKRLVLLVLLATAGVAAADTTPPDVAARCRDAMNNDPVFAKSITDKVDQTRIDQKLLDTHVEANARVQKNEAHVIYAYAALWVIAALFVIFLFFRQQALKAEIATLRRDLEAAAK